MWRLDTATLFLLALLAVPGVAAAEETSLESLLADPGGYDDVTLTGELVGDYGMRGDGWMWTQLNDDGYADAPLHDGGALVGSNVGIGFRVPHALAAGLDPPGRYRRRGPLVEVIGTWRFHDSDRGGESYLEVAELVVLEPGRALEQRVNWMSVVGGSVMLLAAVAVRAMRKREV